MQQISNHHQSVRINCTGHVVQRLDQNPGFFSSDLARFRPDLMGDLRVHAEVWAVAPVRWPDGRLKGGAGGAGWWG